MSLLDGQASAEPACSTVAWQCGGVLNEVAILLFLALAAAQVIRSRRAAHPPGAQARPGRPTRTWARA